MFSVNAWSNSNGYHQHVSKYMTVLSQTNIIKSVIIFLLLKLHSLWDDQEGKNTQNKTKAINGKMRCFHILHKIFILCKVKSCVPKTSKLCHKTIKKSITNELIATKEKVIFNICIFAFVFILLCSLLCEVKMWTLNGFNFMARL